MTTHLNPPPFFPPPPHRLEKGKEYIQKKKKKRAVSLTIIAKAFEETGKNLIL